MFRFVILFISLVWASLLLLSWGTAAEPQAAQQQQIVVTTGS